MNLMAAVGCMSVLVYYPRQSRCAEVIRTLDTLRFRVWGLGVELSNKALGFGVQG